MAKLDQLPWQYRLGVFNRFVAAVLGGYCLTAAVISILSVQLPMAKSDATILSLCLSILVYALIFIWVFSVRQMRVVWLWLGCSTLTLLAYLAFIKDWL